MPRGRPRKHAHHPTAGGRLLRRLRLESGQSLLALEGESSISAAHLQRIEVGDIEKPSYDTVTAILTALHARYFDRREILWAFGYKMPTALPTPEEIEEVRALCRHELDDATIPMYLIDDAQRILAWNRYMPRLIGRHPDDPALSQFFGATTVDLALNPAYGVSQLLGNPNDYLPLLLHSIKTGLQPFQGEAWFQETLQHWQSLPGFSHLWDSITGQAAQRVANQHIIPLAVTVSSAGVLHFRLSSQPFILDPRFQIIPYIPFGAATLRQCAIWAEEEGVL